MIEAIKTMLQRAGQARREGKPAEAEQLYKTAAEDARAKDAVVRAEALMGTAQMRRDRGDRTGASIYYSEAITLLRSNSNTRELAHAMRHAADVRSELKEYAVAGTLIEEAIRIYRAFDPPSPLDLANALRVSALNDEREAYVSWLEARQLYAQLNLAAAIEECNEHLEWLKHSSEASSAASN